MRLGLLVVLVAGCGRVGFDDVVHVVHDASVTPMVSVPVGMFFMGCNGAVDTACNSAEMPGHMVMLTAAYEIDRTEVTEAAYQSCIEAGRCTLPLVFDPIGSPNLPVTQVTWNQAAAYCAWAGKRLPSEAEWEFAARGNDGRIYPWGNDSPTCELVNYRSCGDALVAVGQTPAGASVFGALDMAGNVWEWTNDFFDPSYYASAPVIDPIGPLTGSSHAVRGGYYGNTPMNIRTSNRSTEGDSAPQPWIGFRCAR